MRDIAITDGGDLQISSGGDIAISTHRYSAALQEIYMTVRTERGDFIPYPWFGSDVYKLWGLPNSPRTGTKGVEELAKAITRDGRFSDADIKINAVPVAANQIRFDIDVRFSTNQTFLITLEQKLNNIGED